MTSPDSESPKPQGTAMGLPYDWRKPTAARVRSRLWNPDDGRLFPPKAFGWGLAVNVYWLAHPLRYWRRLSGSR